MLAVLSLKMIRSESYFISFDYGIRRYVNFFFPLVAGFNDHNYQM